jgi:hypothetical protein
MSNRTSGDRGEVAGGRGRNRLSNAPSRGFGPDYIPSFDGVTRDDLNS